jgi:nucleotide-binding universal stress UspA family protein
VFRSILVPIDGSTEAARALAEAVDLAQATGADLAVMTSVPDAVTWGTFSPPSAATDIQALIAESEQGYRSLLDEAVAALPQALAVERVVAQGPAGPAIVQQVAAGGHDLVVMGSRGRGDVASLLLGSVSHHVVHSAKVAVLIVRGPASAERSR